jgi:cysteine desulfurase
VARARINFDQQAAAQLPPEVVEAMLPWLEGQLGNPASLHKEGLKAREALETAREKFAKWIGAEERGEIIFTSSGTEALNLAIKGFALANREFGREILLSQVEHPAILSCAQSLEQDGFKVGTLGVDGEGRISPAEIASKITSETILVVAQHASQDLGTIQATEQIAAVCADKELTLLVDATGSAGWIPLDVARLGPVMACFSALSFAGPNGAGALVKQRRTRLRPIITGGAQEHGLRAGAENVAAIAGLGAAVDWIVLNQEKRVQIASDLQAKIWEGIRSQIPLSRLNGPKPGPGRLPNHLSCSIAHVEGEGLALTLDMKGISVGSAAACVTRNMRIPPSLAAIGCDALYASGTILLTFGIGNTLEEAGRFLETLEVTVKNLREMSPSWEE